VLRDIKGVSALIRNTSFVRGRENKQGRRLFSGLFGR
jgi:hypothetical protein